MAVPIPVSQAATCNGIPANNINEFGQSFNDDEEWPTAHTPTHGGLVETGAEWEMAMGRRSQPRSPSASPSRVPRHGLPPGIHSEGAPQRATSLSYGRRTDFSPERYRPSSSQIRAQNMPSHLANAPDHHSPLANAVSADPPVPISATNGTDATREKSDAVQNAAAQRLNDSTSRPQRSGRQVGDWILGKTLGAGSMGKVKLATNQYTKERCAIKIIPRHSAPDPNLSREETAKVAARDASKETRTIREASISLLLHHPYICGMREMIVHVNHYYMVQEYVDGGQMLDYIISHGRLRERAARKFARQIASALDYCHRNSIVHRDLKIENILISKRGDIKIIDFGLSNLYSPYDHLSTFCGSLYFAAPELLNAKVYTGPEVDVWSFGIVLYVLVCGKVPFDDQSMPALHAKIKRGLVEYPAWLSAECKALLCRMLVTDPAQRATLTEVMQSAWMVKGYDGPPESFLVPREPLRADELDPEVLRGMAGFEFGTEEIIQAKLVDILTSETYRAVLAKWENRRQSRRDGKGWTSETSFSSGSDLKDFPPTSPRKDKRRFSGFDFYKKKFFVAPGSPKEKPATIEAPVSSLTEVEPLDPTRGFHPLLSIYYLVREKIEREKVYGPGQFASSQLSIDGNVDYRQQPHYSMPVPRLPMPESSHVSQTATDPLPSPRMTQGPSVPTAVPRPRAQEDDLRNKAIVAAGLMQHPEEDFERSRLASLDNRPGHSGTLPLRNGMTASASLPPPQSYLSSAPATPVILQESPGTMERAIAAAAAADPDVSGTSHRFNAALSLSEVEAHRVPGQASGISRAQSQRVRTLPSAGQPVTNKNTGDLIQGHRRASTAIEGPDRPPPPAQGSSNTRDANVIDISQDRPAPSPGPDLEAKPVFLKGLFSVATTTTKPIPALQHDVQEVLNRIGIKYRPTKSGFDCVQVPSIALGSVEDPMALHGDVNIDDPEAVTGVRRGTSVRRTNGKAKSPLEVAGLDENDVWAYSESGEAGSSLMVRFEISIVKVPLLGLNGIRFHKVSGDSFRYQMVAKTLLQEMKL